jgi:8-oxo-dGTP pyrophosphatase MutT (NUDIX family)
MQRPSFPWKYARLRRFHSRAARLALGCGPVTAPRVLPELPGPPELELETVHETRFGEGGFLVLRRMQLVVVEQGASGKQARSAPFTYDSIDRRAIDASVMVAHHVEGGRACVWLRSSLRPPLALRPVDPRPPALWELPAGLIEIGESPRAAAARELEEELGFTVPETALSELGPPAHPAPAFIGELHHFFRVEVDPKTRKEPAGDGSAIEAGARIVSVPLDDALEACRTGEIHDEKTELALHRLAYELSRAERPKERA